MTMYGSSSKSRTSFLSKIADSSFNSSKEFISTKTFLSVFFEYSSSCGTMLILFSQTVPFT